MTASELYKTKIKMFRKTKTILTKNRNQNYQFEGNAIPAG